ncbi:YdcF family protein [Paenibacillus rhizovicinus]|uniref:YdcF family protein n=1 Tax=Paenibacillus rhizovicinus TaxID=2704463 RepID=A0A6C0P7D8_9BACL|nr:YdcF family protein [Paenibacillus rhizovicinus]QHW34487.1 YdcF family protein [Paenibacillus rhizovicinus]
MKPAAVPKRTAKRPKRSSRRRFRPFFLLLRICAWVAALGVFWCAYLLWLIAGYDMPKPIPKADAAIILGAALWDDQPSPGLRERLEHGYELYKQGTAKNLIVTGGLDHNGSTLTEAEGMRNFLVAKGVPETAIVMENDARSTYENLLFSKPLAAKRGWDKLLIVTHAFHAPRAEDIAGYLHYPSGTVAVGYKSKVLNMTYNYSREVLAFTKWKMDEQLMRMGIRLPDSF